MDIYEGDDLHFYAIYRIGSEYDEDINLGFRRNFEVITGYDLHDAVEDGLEIDPKAYVYRGSRTLEIYVNSQQIEVVTNFDPRVTEYDGEDADGTGMAPPINQLYLCDEPECFDQCFWRSNE